MPKSFDFGLSKVVPAKRETLLGYALSAPVRARVSRVRAGVLSVSALEQGFPATKCEGPEDKAFLFAFCDINAPICVFLRSRREDRLKVALLFVCLRCQFQSLNRSLAVCAWYCYTI